MVTEFPELRLGEFFVCWDREVELVVVLTPAPSHYELIKQALLAGKHVYTEKTMTVDPAQARELVDLAQGKGLYLGAAPDTFLGAALQKAGEVLQSGTIGQVTGFDVYVNRSLDRMTCLYPFLRLPGGGFAYDEEELVEWLCRPSGTMERGIFQYIII